MPFVADAIYRNLAGAQQPESVHLADWPAAEAARIDPALNHDMQIVQRLVSLGHSARQRSKLKVRQPLTEAAFWAGADAAGVIARHGALIADELNVKQVRLLNSDLEAVAYELHALPRELGQKYGSRPCATHSPPWMQPPPRAHCWPGSRWRCRWMAWHWSCCRLK